jgi:hypothetical protein
VLKRVGAVFQRRLEDLQPVSFEPLIIEGLECLKERTECLGDCPDCAYFGPNIRTESDTIEMLALPTAHDLHIVTLVNHRLLSGAAYGRYKGCSTPLF